MNRLHQSAFVVIAYVAATLAIGSNWGGDTVDYVESIVKFSHGVNHWMWDFAHLLWRPVGWIASTLIHPVTHRLVGPDEHLEVMLTLIAISLIAGLVAALCVHAIALRVSGRMWIANFVALLFIFTHTILNWAQAGSAYVPGLALFLIGLNLMLKEQSSVRASLLAGVAIAAAVCVWVPYLLVVPAALAAASFLYGFTRERLRFAVAAAIVFAIVTGTVYLTVIAGLGFRSVADVRAWIATAGHGLDYHGAKRMVFGFARAFVDMGNDGLLFKRYFLRDPFNPVTPGELVTTAVLKIGVVYLFAIALLLTLRRRMLAFVVLSSAPLLALAYCYSSSEPERYLPLFPVLLIALAAALVEPSRYFRPIAFAFFAVVVASNALVMARPVLHRNHDMAAARLHDLLPRLDQRTLVFTAMYQDELMTFNRTYPFDALNRDPRVHLSTLLSPGTDWNLHWCEDFGSRVLGTWREGGATWVSKRVLAERPRADWHWAEGDDRRVSWRDFPLLFGHLDLGGSAGGDDGFVELLPTAHNKQFLSTLTTAALVAERNTPQPQISRLQN